jgi:MYXO-CTERM domain-containing protein
LPRPTTSMCSSWAWTTCASRSGQPGAGAGILLLLVGALGALITRRHSPRPIPRRPALRDAPCRSSGGHDETHSVRLPVSSRP